MRENYKIIFTLVLIASAYGVNKTGTTSAKFLSIGVGSNAVGMGGAYTAVADDATAMYWNPAGLSFHIQRKYTSITQTGLRTSLLTILDLPCH